MKEIEVLAKLIESLDLESDEEINYNGRIYSIEFEDLEGSGYILRWHDGNATVLVKETLPAYNKKEVILHEIVEGELRFRNVPEDLAHNLAIFYEERYARSRNHPDVDDRFLLESAFVGEEYIPVKERWKNSLDDK